MDEVRGSIPLDSTKKEPLPASRGKAGRRYVDSSRSEPAALIGSRRVLARAKRRVRLRVAAVAARARTTLPQRRVESRRPRVHGEERRREAKRGEEGRGAPLPFAEHVERECRFGERWERIDFQSNRKLVPGDMDRHSSIADIVQFAITEYPLPLRVIAHRETDCPLATNA